MTARTTRGTREAPAKGLPVSQNSTVWAAAGVPEAKRGRRHCSRRARSSDGTCAITRRAPAAVGAAAFPRKEVIQPQLPLRLPCYDFTPITDSTFGRCLPRVGSRTSGVSGFRGVTGGVYKTRERIHRGV